MLNFQSLMTIKQSKEKFMNNHPRMEKFVEDVSNKGFCVGQEVAISVRYPDGEEFKTGIRVKESDMELLNTLRELTR